MVKCDQDIDGVGTVLNVAERMTPNVEPPPFFILVMTTIVKLLRRNNTHTSKREENITIQALIHSLYIPRRSHYLELQNVVGSETIMTGYQGVTGPSQVTAEANIRIFATDDHRTVDGGSVVNLEHSVACSGSDGWNGISRTPLGHKAVVPLQPSEVVRPDRKRIRGSRPFSMISDAVLEGRLQIITHLPR